MPLTGGTLDLGRELGYSLQKRIAIPVVEVTTGEIGDDSLVLRMIYLLPIPVELVCDVESFLRSVEDEVARLLIQLSVGFHHVDLVDPAGSFEDLQIVRVIGPWEYSSLGEREIRIDDIILQKSHACPESVTIRTGSLVGVEREVRDRELLTSMITQWT